MIPGGSNISATGLHAMRSETPTAIRNLCRSHNTPNVFQAMNVWTLLQ